MADITPAAQPSVAMSRGPIFQVAKGLVALRCRIAAGLDIRLQRSWEGRSARALRAMEAARHREEMRRQIDRMMR